MNQNHELGGLVVGLLAGALLGALIFSLLGSLNLGFGLLLILLVALASAGIGWFVGPAFMKWRENQIKPLTEREEYRGIVEQRKLEIIDIPGLVETTKTFQVDLLRLGGLSFFFFMLIIVFVFLTWYQDIFQWIYFAAFFAVLALFNLMKIIRNSNKSVEISSQGIKYKTKNGARLIEWKEVEFIWEKQERIQYSLFPIKHEHYVVLDLRDGNSIKLDRNLKDFGMLANLLHEGVTRIQLPIAMRGLKNGATIDFKILKLNEKGIFYKNKSISWQDIDRILMNHARVMIQKTGKNWVSWADIKGWDLPNLRLFALIANEYTKVV
jgi:hypothetical protein